MRLRKRKITKTFTDTDETGQIIARGSNSKQQIGHYYQLQQPTSPLLHTMKPCNTTPPVTSSAQSTSFNPRTGHGHCLQRRCSWWPRLNLVDMNYYLNIVKDVLVSKERMCLNLTFTCTPNVGLGTSGKISGSIKQASSSILVNKCFRDVLVLLQLFC